MKKRQIGAVLALCLTICQIGLMVPAQASQEGDNVPFQAEQEDLPRGEWEQSQRSDGKAREETEEIPGDQPVRVIVELEKNSILEEAIARDQEYSELPEKFIEKKTQEILKDQKKTLQEIRSEVEVDTSQLRSYDTVLNGMAFSVQEKDINRLEEIEGVSHVYIAQEYARPLLQSSSEMIGSDYVHNSLRYRGEGMVVAVIDSGLDYRHKAFHLQKEEGVKLDEGASRRLIRENHLKGKYYSAKIPYGYNYYDHSDNLYDSYGVMHGMHVAGIVGANDAEAGLYGVAPEAQILAMKIFSDDLQYPTTFTDIWLKALDDAITLKADAVNMSLGSAAGFSIEGREYPEEKGMERAKKAGGFVSIAAGNDGSLMDGNRYGEKALEENYDTALIANPALDEPGMAVASMENTKKTVPILTWKDRNGREVQDNITIQVPEGQKGIVSGKFVDLGQGQNLASVNLQGKIALVEIPDKTAGFGEILDQTAQKNPLALVLYNSAAQGEKIGSSLEITGRAAAFVTARIKRSTYEAIKEESLYSMRFTLNIHTQPVAVNNPLAGRMSTFSSWGPTPDLRMKPEITAPGGNIYSTKEDDGYQNMSGTSMAAPQVAGAAALAMQYLKEQKLEGNPADLAKTLLMNTAVPIVDADSYGGSTPYFVRQQGAGAMDIKGALESGALVTATGTHDALEDGKLELGQLQEKKFQARLRIQNFSKEDKIYSVYGEAIYEPAEGGRRSGIPGHLLSDQDNKEETVEVKAGESRIVTMEFDYSDGDALRENNFLEGFIYLKGINTQDLSVPFLGFYGDWSSARALDAFQLPEKQGAERSVQLYANQDNKITSSLFVTEHLLALPVVENTLYFAPGNEYYGKVGVRIAPLRNIEELTYSILDGETGQELRTLGMSRSVRKLYRLDVNKSFRIMPDSLWDGLLSGERLQEGREYIYRIKARLNTGGLGEQKEQIYDYPIKCDTTSPRFLDIGGERVLMQDLGDRMKRITFQVEDTGSGLADVYLQSMKYVEESSGARIPKYSKYVKLTFTDEAMREGKLLPKVEEGKLIIPGELIPRTPEDNTEIFVNRNGNRNRPVEIVTDYFADTSHVMVLAQDMLTNSEQVIVPTGESKNYSSVIFMNYAYDLKKAGAQVYVNDHLLDREIYGVDGERAVIKIQLPKGKYLHQFSIRKMKKQTFFMKEGEVQYEHLAPYHFQYDPEENFVTIEVEGLTSALEVYTTVKEGTMPRIIPKTQVDLDLSAFDSKEFQEIKVDNQRVYVDPLTKKIQVETGILRLEGVFAPGADKKIHSVILRQGGVDQILKKRMNFDIVEGKTGYSLSSYSIYLCLPIQGEASLILEYENPKATSSNAQAPSREEGTKDGMEEQATGSNAKKQRYPVIFIQSPGLLDVLGEKNLVDGNISVKGFVGNIKPGDEIESLSLFLVDAEGNPLGEEVVLHKEDFTLDYPKIGSLSGMLRNGVGYFFETKIKPKGFGVNLKARLLTKNQETASIVRRFFLDQTLPQVSYQVADRKLGDAVARIRISAKDDSLKLKLYRNDSLVGMADKTDQTFIQGGVAIEKEIEVSLHPGQNEIRLLAVDLAGGKRELRVYLYRTASGESASSAP